MQDTLPLPLTPYGSVLCKAERAVDAAVYPIARPDFASKPDTCATLGQNANETVYQFDTVGAFRIGRDLFFLQISDYKALTPLLRVWRQATHPFQ